MRVEAARSEQLPLKLGRFELEEVIAVGGMAVLYTAHLRGAPNIATTLAI